MKTNEALSLLSTLQFLFSGKIFGESKKNSFFRPVCTLNNGMSKFRSWFINRHIQITDETYFPHQDISYKNDLQVQKFSSKLLPQFWSSELLSLAFRIVVLHSCGFIILQSNIIVSFVTAFSFFRTFVSSSCFPSMRIYI